MKVEKVVLREIGMRLKAPFETSFGACQDRRILLVEVHSDGIVGWGEATVPEGPYYNSESTDTAWIVLRNFLVPAVLGKSFATATELPQAMARVRGHEMSKAAIENAIWDIEAQQKGLPLHKLLGGTFDPIVCGVSLGIQPNPNLLLEKVRREVAAGYQRIKLKIKPGNDLAAVRAVREEFPAIKLSVDANSAYRLQDIDLLKQLDQYNLLMIEQPLEWDEIYLHAKLQSQLKTAICLDECIHNLRDATTAVSLGACRIVNIKLGRVGGHTEARRIQEFARQKSVPVWCGGMLESGIGRAHNIAMSTLPGFVLPGDVSASRRYWDQDIIEPEVEVSPQGTIAAPTRPGIGYAVLTDRVRQLTARELTWNATATVNVPEPAPESAPGLAPATR